MKARNPESKEILNLRSLGDFGFDRLALILKVKVFRQIGATCSFFKRDERHGWVFNLGCQQDRTSGAFIIFSLSQKSDGPLAKCDFAVVLFGVNREFALQEGRYRGGRG